jgi:hypothetical protein
MANALLRLPVAVRRTWRLKNKMAAKAAILAF